MSTPPVNTIIKIFEPPPSPNTKLKSKQPTHENESMMGALGMSVGIHPKMSESFQRPWIDLVREGKDAVAGRVRAGRRGAGLYQSTLHGT